MKRLVQSHFVQAEKPYHIFGYLENGPILACGKLIGNIINLFQDDSDEEGKVIYEHVPVFRNTCRDDNSSIEIDHAFVGDEQQIVSSTCFLGVEGEQVGLDAINEMRYLDSLGENNTNPREILGLFHSIGLEYEKLTDEIKKCNDDGSFENMEICVNNRLINTSPKSDGERGNFLFLSDKISLYTRLDDSYICPIIHLAEQLYDWYKLGVNPTFVVDDKFFGYADPHIARQSGGSSFVFV